ncbi:MAG TPA: T9SS type A sorting domain-containing protein [Ignavibacteria bacterium]|nr:T9SS type A sorting domain-containing protein [Ignavibacteria bacterium]
MTLKVYDVTGNEVAVLVNEELSAGKYNVDFNASNLASGTYFYRLQTAGFTQTKKLTMIK